MKDSEGDSGAGFAFAMVAVVILAIAWVIHWALGTPEGRKVIGWAVKVPIIGILTLGMAANVGVRMIIGLWGDRKEVTPEVGRDAFYAMLLTPVFVFATILYLLILASVSKAAFAVVLILGIFVVCLLPFYYWGYWAKEIPWVHWQFDVPYKTDAVMRVEGQLILARWKLFAAQTYLRIRLAILGFKEKGKP